MNKVRLTAVNRKKLSKPMEYLKPLLKGACLDYGCGRGFDADFLHIDGYDPYWNRPLIVDKKYDTITCNYVLNVVNKRTQNKIIRHIFSLLKPNGVAYFTVRRDIKEDYKSLYCTQRVVILPLESIYHKPRAFEIYKLERK